MIIFLLILSSIVGLYLLYMGLIYVFQFVLIFKPEKLPVNHQFTFRGNFKEFYLSTEDGHQLNCLWFRVANPKGCVLYHHGNAHNLDFWGKEFELFTKQGYDVLFYDYRGYGKSTGTIYPGVLKSDAYIVYLFLIQHYSPNEVIQYGRSLGTGIATKLAYKVKAPLLILETPYLSLLEMARNRIPLLPHKLLMKFPMRTDFYITHLTCPIFVFHGTEDEQIPYRQSLRLKLHNKKIKFIGIRGARHMNLKSYDEFVLRLNKILIDFFERKQ